MIAAGGDSGEVLLFLNSTHSNNPISTFKIPICSFVTSISAHSVIPRFQIERYQLVEVGQLVGIGEGEGDLAVPIPVEKRSDRDADVGINDDDSSDDGCGIFI